MVRLETNSLVIASRLVLHTALRGGCIPLSGGLLEIVRVMGWILCPVVYLMYDGNWIHASHPHCSVECLRLTDGQTPHGYHVISLFNTFFQLQWMPLIIGSGKRVRVLGPLREFWKLLTMISGQKSFRFTVGGSHEIRVMFDKLALPFTRPLRYKCVVDL